MERHGYSSRGRSRLVATLAFCAFFTAPAGAREGIDNANAKAAGQRAHFAHEFCGVSAERIENYRLKFKATLRASTDFDVWWKRGWHSEVAQTTQLRAMQAGNPKEYAARVRSDCARLKWQANNALRKGN
ncbi:hypothetical protein [Paraburkholderia sp. BCC1884]|uniref:hypothetical protein n=1 Tax=Paraburkholderia sp. BCC1884 TaxID=2562668 RepID=UPI001181E707|nr:hypothetical protein [Paraburkholderia sp. BCC1884]